MDMIRHDARRVQLVAVISPMEQTIQNNLARFRRERRTFACRECDRVFAPWTLKVRQTALRVFDARRGLRRAAGDSTRAACAPQNSRYLALEKLDASVQCLVK